MGELPFYFQYVSYKQRHMKTLQEAKKVKSYNTYVQSKSRVYIYSTENPGYIYITSKSSKIKPNKVLLQVYNMSTVKIISNQSDPDIKIHELIKASIIILVELSLYTYDTTNPHKIYKK